jgi:hypothetical protein
MIGRFGLRAAPLMALAAVVMIAAGFDAPGSTAGRPAIAAGCSSTSATRAWNGGFPQVFGTRHGHLRALFFLPQQASWTDPNHAVFAGLLGQEVKIAWGMTGSGRFRVAAYGPSGERLLPTWGPQRHAGGNWVHPGGEWGTGFVFPSAGCWRIHARRAYPSGNIWLLLK